MESNDLDESLAIEMGMLKERLNKVIVGNPTESPAGIHTLNTDPPSEMEENLVNVIKLPPADGGVNIDDGNCNALIIQRIRESLHMRAVRIIQDFKNEFGKDMKRNKLILKLVTCGKKGCNSCPHGPYWYRAVYNPKTNKWIFRYVKSELNKGLLMNNEERQLWPRYNFYNDQIKKLRADRKRLVRGNEMGIRRYHESCLTEDWIFGGHDNQTKEL